MCGTNITDLFLSTSERSDDIITVNSPTMAQKRHLWYTKIDLTTFERSGDLIICFVMANSLYIPNLGSQLHPHGLEEAPVVHTVTCIRDTLTRIIFFSVRTSPTCPPPTYQI